MQRKLTLSKDAILWEAGENARTIGVLEKGKLGVRVDTRVVGIIQPRMVLGESAIFTLDGQPQKRTATIYALEDDTQVTEYPPTLIKSLFDTGNDAVTPSILMTLLGQISRNTMMIMAAHKDKPLIDKTLRRLTQGLLGSIDEFKNIRGWDAFMDSFRFLNEVRDFSGTLRSKMLLETSDKRELLERATSQVMDLFKDQAEIAPFLEDFIRAEKDRADWLE